MGQRGGISRNFAEDIGKETFFLRRLPVIGLPTQCQKDTGGGPLINPGLEVGLFDDETVNRL